jgi:S1-C subfamily serine protease
MNDEPRRDAAETGASSSTGSDWQAPPEGSPASREPLAPEPLAPASGTGDVTPEWEETRVYSPALEPRRDWSQSSAWQASGGESPSWGQPAARPDRVSVAARGGRPSPLGEVILASVIAAVVASGGTFLALDASGALDHRSTNTATTPAGATTTARQNVTLDESSAIIDVAAKAGPAVVRITAEGTNVNGLGAQIPQTGVGSGVIYDASGWILTNRHVVTNDSDVVVAKLTVELKDGRQFEGHVYGVDTLTDLAIVKIQATGLPSVALGDSDALKVGQLVIAIGSPLGLYSNSVTSGIVSAKGRPITVDSGKQLTNLIQTDAAINPGNSGGPLLDAGGNVIGINTAVAPNSSGIGFAIPINIAKPIMQQALAGQKIARPYIGIRYESIDLQLATTDKLPVQEGAIVKGGQDQAGQTSPGVVPGSPADKAGIHENDIIVTVEGHKIDGEHPLDAVLSQFAPGQTVTVTILRDGHQQDVSVTLGTRPTTL